MSSVNADFIFSMSLFSSASSVTVTQPILIVTAQAQPAGVIVQL
tara:strand:- start:600 stop:731 length:132 start_codon:yes stop_codon:yes gene_type:complete